MSGVLQTTDMPPSVLDAGPMTSQPPVAIAIDWGSTHRRAYIFDAQGGLIGRHADAQGVLTVGKDFAGALTRLLAQLGAGPTCRVLLSGMIGSRAGWVEAPYLLAPLAVQDIARQLLPVEFAGALVSIVPGVCDDAGPDVMRGEETQLLGAWLLDRTDGTYLLPGTHSKWVTVQDGKLQRLHTFMTGELFASLRQHGTLAAVLGERADIWQAFDGGLVAAASGGATSRLLFGVRAAVLRERYGPDEALSYLSGLLIGMEWADPLTRPLLGAAPLRLVGDSRLAELYARAASYWQQPIVCVDPDAAYIAAAGQLLGLGIHHD